AFPDENEPVGAVATYTTGNWIIDLVLLPALIEGGPRHSDQSLYAIDVMHDLAEALGMPGRAGVIIAANNTDTNRGAAINEVHARIFTIGGGTSIMVTEGIEIYGEVYLQTGKAAEDATGGDIDAAGQAYQFGLEWNHTVGNPMPIRAGFNYFYISGDGDTSATDDEANRFAAYENVNQLMIMENQYLGFDWDSNYTGFKLMGGTAFTVMEENDLDVELVVGFLRTAEDVVLGTQSEDALGTEVDLKFNWSLNDQFSLQFALAFLTGSDVLELAMDGGVPGSNPNSSDSADMYVLGFDMAF
ncbi:MAG: hypothetical protein R3246_17575, partial [Acidimicrobiia bacterium]|nr:hypothetical protein [Acidimicrobiia bacterium]